MAAITTMADALGMEVVAEGVETATQADMLHSLGNAHAQGYYYGKPMAAKRPCTPYGAVAGMTIRIVEGVPAAVSLDRPRRLAKSRTPSLLVLGSSPASGGQGPVPEHGPRQDSKGAVYRVVFLPSRRRRPWPPPPRRHR